MKIRIFVITVLLMFQISNAVVCGQARAQDPIEYTIQIARDGSAGWIIMQTGIDINFSSYTLTEFQTKVTSLAEDAANETGRKMAANATSVTFTPSGSYVVVEYRFYWANFSKIQDATILVGDVFQAKDFFGHLYGDGKVYITYPSEFVLEMVSPTPYEHITSSQTLVWVGTMNFNEDHVSIVLKEKSTPAGFMKLLGQNALLIIGIIVLSSGLFASLYTFMHYRKERNEKPRKREPLGFPNMESDEDKIVKLLKSSRGTMYQSAITDQCKFSKAKTSQILSTLENKGTVTRYKKGRDKVVVLGEQGKK